jgi:uridylate kinase
MQRLILKISGEALSENGIGISVEKVNNIANEIKQLHDLGDIQLGIICGAGNIWRGRDAIKNGMDRTNADYMGMLGTILNCVALQSSLEKLGLETRVMTSLSIPELAEPYIRRKADSHLNKGRICIFGGGTGNPFFSTDTTAALRASELGCSRILMAKNGTDGVYDSDPRKNKNAIKFSKISHQELLERKLEVMDLTASTLCASNNIDIFVFDMNVKGNIKKAANDLSIGTLVTTK